MTNGDLETWTDNHNALDWGCDVEGTSSVNKDSNPYAGTYAARLDVDASNSLTHITRAVRVLTNIRYRLKFYYRMSANKPFSLQCGGRDLSGVYHSMREDGTFVDDDTLYDIYLTYSAGYVAYEVVFTTPSDVMSLILTIGVPAIGDCSSSSLWIDSVSLKAD